jgi:hypothetical protein
MRWPASFVVDDQVRHCGRQYFDMVREAGQSRIQDITWSVRVSGCDGWRTRLTWHGDAPMSVAAEAAAMDSLPRNATRSHPLSWSRSRVADSE